MATTIKRILFIVFLITASVTFFTHRDYRKVDDIHPAVLNQPLQTEVSDESIIKFNLDDYAYELTPLYDYEINGLIVNKLDYSFLAVYERNKVSPMDLCIIWGSNVKSRVFQEKDLEFTQDYRFCNYRWRGEIKFNPSEGVNNHLVVDNKEMEKKIRRLKAGDQVRIRGKLVDLVARRVGEIREEEPEYFELKTSVTRDDTGAGACEEIYVEELEILKEGNPVSSMLFKVSIYSLAFLFAVNIIGLFV